MSPLVLLIALPAPPRPRTLLLRQAPEVRLTRTRERPRPLAAPPRPPSEELGALLVLLFEVPDPAHGGHAQRRDQLGIVTRGGGQSQDRVEDRLERSAPD
jgi:hypothetical protein